MGKSLGILVLLVIVAETLNATGQTFFKKTANVLEGPLSSTLGSALGFFSKVLRSPWIWLGLSSMGLGLVFWLSALSRADLSLVYPIGSIHYLLVMLFARVFLKEKMDFHKILGTLLVIFGIVLIAQS